MSAESRQVTDDLGGEHGQGDPVPVQGSRRAHLEAHLAGVARAQRALEREGRRIPWLVITALLAVPVGLIWGAGAALFALAASVTVAVVSAYISWAHRQEYTDAESVIRRQLAEIEQPRAHGPRAGRPWRVPGKALQLFER